MLSSLAIGFASDESGGEDDLEPVLAASGSSSSSVAREVKYDSLAGAALRAVEDGEGGMAHIDDIVEFIIETWARPTPALASDEALRNAIVLTLRTNPLFVEPRANPGFYRLADVCRMLPRRWRCGSRSRAIFARDDSAAASGGGGGGGNSGNASRRQQRSTSKRSRPGNATQLQQLLQQGPIVCYHCGATTPGRGPNARWKRGPKAGETACLACHMSRPRKHSCPICGKPYNQPNTATAAASAEGERPVDDDEWIQCDECDRWIMARCDKEIVDLSLYDDSNPNHLHYSCPLCRDRRQQQQQQQQAALPSVAPSPSAVSAAGIAVSSSSAATPAMADGSAEEPRRKRANVALDDPLAAEEADTVPIEEELAALSERLDAVVADAMRQAAIDYPATSSAAAAPLSAMAQEELRAFKATLLKRCENAVHRLQRDHERQLERARRDYKMQRQDIEEDFVRQFRDHTDRLFSRSSERP